MNNTKQNLNLNTIANTISTNNLINRLVQKNLKGGIGACPPPTTDEY